MYQAKVFATFSEAAESARWIARRASSDVVVRAVDEGWTLEIEALRKIEEAFLRDLMASALAEHREDLIPVVDQSSEGAGQFIDLAVLVFDGDPAEAVNDQWNSGEPDWMHGAEQEVSASG